MQSLLLVEYRLYNQYQPHSDAALKKTTSLSIESVAIHHHFGILLIAVVQLIAQSAVGYSLIQSGHQIISTECMVCFYR